jgi:hypothetical protein
VSELVFRKLPRFAGPLNVGLENPRRSGQGDRKAVNISLSDWVNFFDLTDHSREVCFSELMLSRTK